MRFEKLLAVWFVVVLAGVSPVVAQGGTGEANIRITVTVGDADPSAEQPTQRTFELVTRAREQAEMLAGWRIPIPVTTFPSPGDAGAAAPMTSFSYQNVGMTAQLEAIVDGKDIFVRGQIEISAAEDGPKTPTGRPTAPVVGTFQQQFAVVLKEGEALEIARISDPEVGSRALRLEAEILD